MDHQMANPQSSSALRSTELVLQREVDVTPEQLFAAWTKPEHVPHWFCPAPWTVTGCEIDLRPGGVFATTMRSPEGEEFPNVGCFLEIVPDRRLVWTDALGPGFAPSERPFFTGILTFEPTASGALYTARGLHKDEASRKQHEEMGFHEGWGKVLDQLVAYIKTNDVL